MLIADVGDDMSEEPMSEKLTVVSSTKRYAKIMNDDVDISKVYSILKLHFITSYDLVMKEGGLA